MSTNLLAMHAVLAELDIDRKDGKFYKNKEAQQPFWVQLTENDQLKDINKGESFTAKTLRIAVGYMIRDKKRKEYAKTHADEAMNLFFTIGREMIDPGYVTDIENAARENDQGTYVPELKKKKGKGKSKSKAVILKIPSPRTLKEAEEKESGDVESNQIFVPVNHEPMAMVQQPTSSKRPRTADTDLEDRPQKRIRIYPSLPNPVDEKKRKRTDETDTTHVQKRVKQDNNVDMELPVHHHPRKQPLGSISQAEILLDLKNINIAITDVLAGSSFPYTPSSPGLCFANSSKAQTLELKTDHRFLIKETLSYQPSSPNLSTKPLNRDVIWSLLMTDFFSKPPPSQLFEPEMQRTVSRACHILGKGIDVDGVMREMMLEDHRNDIKDLNMYGEKGILTILQRAQNLKAKMDVSREKFGIVRDEEGGWTGVVPVPAPPADANRPGLTMVVPLTERFDSVMG